MQEAPDELQRQFASSIRPLRELAAADDRALVPAATQQQIEAIIARAVSMLDRGESAAIAAVITGQNESAPTRPIAAGDLLRSADLVHAALLGCLGPIEADER